MRDYDCIICGFCKDEVQWKEVHSDIDSPNYHEMLMILLGQMLQSGDSAQDLTNTMCPEHVKGVVLACRKINQRNRRGQEWKLWLDDQMNEPEMYTRHCPPGHIGAASFEEAKALVEELGPPYHVDLDHDLGLGCPNGMDFLKWLAEHHYEYCPVTWKSHSANPVGRDNMISFLESWDRNLKAEFSR